MDFKNLLSEDVISLLSEETLTAIQEAFNKKVELQVESALEEQDEIYAEKLEALVESIDKDRSEKLVKVASMIDKNNSAKLTKIVKLYERDSQKDAVKFKKFLTESIDSYLNDYLEDAIPSEQIAEAVRNKTAMSVLGNLRDVLAVDSVMMKESVQSAMQDGKMQINDLKKANAILKENYNKLFAHAQELETEAFLESKLAKMPEQKRNFVRKAMKGKTLDFIKENVDYSIRMFDKTEAKALKTLKEEAFEQREVKPDVIIEEKINPQILNNDSGLTNDYISVLDSQSRR